MGDAAPLSPPSTPPLSFSATQIARGPRWRTLSGQMLPAYGLPMTRTAANRPPMNRATSEEMRKRPLVNHRRRSRRRSNDKVNLPADDPDFDPQAIMKIIAEDPENIDCTMGNLVNYSVLQLAKHAALDDFQALESHAGDTEAYAVLADEFEMLRAVFASLRRFLTGIESGRSELGSSELDSIISSMVTIEEAYLKRSDRQDAQIINPLDHTAISTASDGKSSSVDGEHQAGVSDDDLLPWTSPLKRHEDEGVAKSPIIEEKQNDLPISRSSGEETMNSELGFKDKLPAKLLNEPTHPAASGVTSSKKRGAPTSFDTELVRAIKRRPLFAPIDVQNASTLPPGEDTSMLPAGEDEQRSESTNQEASEPADQGVSARSTDSGNSRSIDNSPSTPRRRFNPVVTRRVDSQLRDIPAEQTDPDQAIKQAPRAVPTAKYKIPENRARIPGIGHLVEYHLDVPEGMRLTVEGPPEGGYHPDNNTRLFFMTMTKLPEENKPGHAVPGPRYQPAVWQQLPSGYLQEF